MDLSPLGWLAVLVPLASSVTFFVLTEHLPLASRVFASAHGIVAIAILPLLFATTAFFPDLGESGGTVILLLVGGVAATSIVFAIARARVRWFYHLLHAPTVAVIAGGFVFALFLLEGR